MEAFSLFDSVWATFFGCAGGAFREKTKKHSKKNAKKHREKKRHFRQTKNNVTSPRWKCSLPSPLFFRKKMKPHFSKEKRIKKRSDFQKLPGLPAYYIFQPGDITDENISIKYRYLPNYRHHNYRYSSSKYEKNL